MGRDARKKYLNSVMINKCNLKQLKINMVGRKIKGDHNSCAIGQA